MPIDSRQQKETFVLNFYSVKYQNLYLLYKYLCITVLAVSVRVNLIAHHVYSIFVWASFHFEYTAFIERPDLLVYYDISKLVVWSFIIKPQ